MTDRGPARSRHPITWRFEAGNDAIRTTVGEKTDRMIRVRSAPGCALFGPYLDIPPGTCTARILIAGRREGQVYMDIAAGKASTVVASRTIDLGTVSDDALELSAELPEPAADCEIRLFCTSEVWLDIRAVEIELQGREPGPLDSDRPVGHESRKTYAAKIASGFFDTYLSGGAIVELGYIGGREDVVPIVPQAIGIDIGYPGYDGIRLPFADQSLDAIYSSHCFEHIREYLAALREWDRVLKIGGYLVIVVPHQHLFERRLSPPSRWNPDHKRFYTPASLLREVEEAFAPNTYRVRHLVDNDLGYDYSVKPSDPATFESCCEIELVLEKRQKPAWGMEDGATRGYHPSEFSTLSRTVPWCITLDFSVTDRCVIWGPYIPLAAGDYEVQFFLEATDLDDQPLASEIVLDVSQDTASIARVSLLGEAGARTLSQGSVPLRFTNSLDQALFEFRVHTASRPFPGTLRFNGVILNRLWE